MTLEKVKLGAVAKVLNGYAFKSKEYVDHGIRVIRITNVQKGRIQDDDPKFIDIHRSDEFARFMLADGDILISLTGNVGRVGVIEKSLLPAALNQRVGALKIESEIVDPEYLFHMLNSDNFEQDAIKNSKGIAQLNLSSKWVEKYEIPLRLLAEQKRIAGILDAAGTLRAKRREALAQLDTLLQSTFLDMFGDPVTNPMGWEQSPLGKLCDVGSSKRVFVNELVEEGVPFYRGTEVGSLGEGEAVTPTLFITHDHYEQLKRHSGVPRPGDLLLPSICPDGRIFIVRDDKPFYFKDGRVLWIKAGESGINSTFLRYHLKAVFFTDYSKIASGTTFAELKIFPLKDLVVHVPPRDEQNRFTKFVESIEGQKARMRAHLAELDALFASLQSRAINGEL